MKIYILKIVLVVCFIIPSLMWSQENFSFDAYQDYLKSTENMSVDALSSEYPIQNTYYKQLNTEHSIESAAYLDSVIEKYELTADEIQLLMNNHFMVTERLDFSAIGQAFHDIYIKDMPVFVTTDAILQALHSSYDRILMDLEIELLEPSLAIQLEKMYERMPDLLSKYANAGFDNELGDVDLYITMALSLLRGEAQQAQSDFVDNFDDVWQAIQAEQPASMSLFTFEERTRQIDFSQFTVRGHYTKAYWKDGESRTLEDYFKAMMWLGRIDFWLTPPPVNPFEKEWEWHEVQRMARASLLMNELMESANVWEQQEEIDKIITFFVGESDNMTPAELAQVCYDNNITVESLADSASLAAFQEKLLGSDEYGQKILSSIMMMDPYSDEPGVLPVSYRLMGQRFIIDSYVLGNVVFDRIVFNGAKVWRPLPSPLDAMFVLGNDNTLPLLKEELETYNYAQNLASLRYLVESYDASYWEKSLYNVWLNTIRTINPTQDLETYPEFMKSAAWHQLKLNTQLASWAQLRHDNLLYAKQSYTGATGCSFPHSFVEPYPEFYRGIQLFADKAAAFFEGYSQDSYIMPNILDYFERLGNNIVKLESLSLKELNNEAFNDNDIEFLQSMLFVGGGSGQPPFTGWYADLYYEREDPALIDHVIADVHTQPTDQGGAPVGHVLHVSVGKFQLGFFAAPCPTNEYETMIFVGPVMSYYQQITKDFKRLTDEEWKESVETGNVPDRPDWVNIFLADESGNAMQQGRELPAVVLTDIGNEQEAVPMQFSLEDNYPNPFNPQTTIHYSIAAGGHVKLSVYDLLGREIQVLVNGNKTAGRYQVVWNSENFASGIYFYKIVSGNFTSTKKMTLLK